MAIGGYTAHRLVKFILTFISELMENSFVFYYYIFNFELTYYDINISTNAMFSSDFLFVLSQQTANTFSTMHFIILFT